LAAAVAGSIRSSSTDVVSAQIIDNAGTSETGACSLSGRGRFDF
jgi:hypothetical protein